MTFIPDPKAIRATLLKNYGSGHTLLLSRDDVMKRQPDGGATIYIATGFTWDETSEGGWIDNSQGIRHADQFVQTIMDEAWTRGFRPTGYANVQNETAAIRQHLNDLRTVAFHALKIKGAQDNAK